MFGLNLACFLHTEHALWAGSTMGQNMIKSRPKINSHQLYLVDMGGDLYIPKVQNEWPTTSIKTFWDLWHGLTNENATNGKCVRVSSIAVEELLTYWTIFISISRSFFWSKGIHCEICGSELSGHFCWDLTLFYYPPTTITFWKNPWVLLFSYVRQEYSYVCLILYQIVFICGAMTDYEHEHKQQVNRNYFLLER